jgi:hypothetical protein
LRLSLKKLKTIVNVARVLAFFIASIGLAISNFSFASCGEQFNPTTKQLVETPNFTIAYQPSLWPIPVGKHFSVLIQVCNKISNNVVSDIKIDADMPAHKHGMNYKTVITKQSETIYLAQGLMFHMPGQWRVLFEFESSENPGQKIRANKEHRIE